VPLPLPLSRALALSSWLWLSGKHFVSSCCIAVAVAVAADDDWLRLSGWVGFCSLAAWLLGCLVGS